MNTYCVWTVNISTDRVLSLLAERKDYEDARALYKAERENHREPIYSPEGGCYIGTVVRMGTRNQYLKILKNS